MSKKIIMTGILVIILLSVISLYIFFTDNRETFPEPNIRPDIKNIIIHENVSLLIYPTDFEIDTKYKYDDSLSIIVPNIAIYNKYSSIKNFTLNIVDARYYESQNLAPENVTEDIRERIKYDILNKNQELSPGEVIVNEGDIVVNGLKKGTYVIDLSFHYLLTEEECVGISVCEIYEPKRIYLTIK